MCLFIVCFFFFFFKQKTAYEMRISDWSSDVCSSDLAGARSGARGAAPVGIPVKGRWDHHQHRRRPEAQRQRQLGRARQLPVRTERRHLHLCDRRLWRKQSQLPRLARKSVSEGKQGPVRVDLGGPRNIKTKEQKI